MSEPKVFISYAHSDQEWARQFADALGQAGFKVGIEFDLSRGDIGQDAMEESLRDSDFIVVLVRPDSLDRPKLYFEIGAALGMKKTIIPIVPEDFESSKIPLVLRRKRLLTRRSPSQSAEEFASTIAVMTGEAA